MTRHRLVPVSLDVRIIDTRRGDPYASHLKLTDRVRGVSQPRSTNAAHRSCHGNGSPCVRL